MTNAVKAQLRRSHQIAAILEGLFGRPSMVGRRSNPLDTLIATLLSQNTNDRNSYRAWLSLRKKFPSWGQVSSASWQSIAQAIKVGGLKNQKAQRIKKILQSIHAERGRYDLNFLKGWSDTQAMAYLLRMNGVGEKTAACVLVFALGRDSFPVDTHIHRICNRLGLVKTKSAVGTFEAMKDLLPAGAAYSFHVNLIRFGRETCKAGRPLCGGCPLFDECAYPERHRFAASTIRSRPANDKASRFLITEEITRNAAR
jgi:endonuclease III